MSYLPPSFTPSDATRVAAGDLDAGQVVVVGVPWWERGRGYDLAHVDAVETIWMHVEPGRFPRPARTTPDASGPGDGTQPWLRVRHTLHRADGSSRSTFFDLPPHAPVLVSPAGL